MYANYIYISLIIISVQSNSYYASLHALLFAKTYRWTRVNMVTNDTHHMQLLLQFSSFEPTKRTAEAKLFACDHCILRYSKS